MDKRTTSEPLSNPTRIEPGQHERFWERPIPSWAWVVLFAAAYFAGAEVSRWLALRPGPFITFWIPIGLYLTVLLRSEPRRWPLFVVAAAAANVAFDLWEGKTLPVCLGFASAYGLEALAGAWLVRRVLGPSFTLGRLDHLLGIAAVVILGSAPLGATIGAATLALDSGASFVESWPAWWAADIAGVLAVLPLTLIAFPDEQSPPLTKLGPPRMLEAVVALLAAAAAAQHVFGTSPPDLPFPLLIVGPMAWMAFRFGWRGVALVVVLSASIAVLNTQSGRGPFVGEYFTPASQVTRLQSFLSLSSLAFLSLAAVLHERRRAEQSLRQSEECYRTLVEASPHMVWALRPDWTMAFASRTWTEFTGKTAEPFTPQQRGELCHPDDLERVLAAIAGPWERGEPHEIEFRNRRHDGQYRWVNSRAAPVRNESGAVVLWIGTTTDIHERQQAEEALREKETRNRSLVAALAERVWVTGPHGEVRDSEDQWEELTGQSPEQAGGDGWLEALHPEDRAAAGQRWQQALATRRPYEAEFRVRRPNGEWRHMLSRGLPVLDQAGQVREWVGVLFDITERKRAEQSERDARHMLETILDNIPQGVFWKDRDSRYLGCNAVVSRAFGVSQPESMIGKTDHDLPCLRYEEAAFFQQKDREVMQAGQPIYGIIEPATLADGSSIWMETSKIPLRDALGRIIGILGTWQDITERKRLEEELRQSQKMEAIGRLAGGVAHDFNNLLTVISGYTDLVLASLRSSDPNRDALNQVRDAGLRAASLTRQLLAFSRRQVLAPKVLDLNDVVDRCEKMLRRLIGEDISVLCVLPRLWHQVKVDPGQIEQVVMNLAINARDAMPQGGKLTIETRQDEVTEEDRLAHPELKVGRYVILAVSDTGCGMTKEVKERIFEPFFTTKEPGKGTGLGLATVYGIVQQSEGHITVASQVGVGTTFRVYFPAVTEEPTAAAPDALAGAARGHETILLVEDEPAVRSLARLVLAAQGYRVLVAEHGVEALQVAEKHAGPIHILVTDVVMPEMGGRVLAEQLHPRQPDMRVLFMSGYTDDAVVRHGILTHEAAFLQKPFSPLGLARKVREVLNDGT